MLHIIAFIAIGIVVGYVVARGSRSMPVAVILGLVGSFAGGELTRSHKYLSLVAAIIGAVILSYIAKAVTGKK